MGTRGAYGFRQASKDVVTYNHFDSYADGLGRSVLRYIAQTPLPTMKEVASRIILVNEESKPTPELIQDYEKYSDIGVADHSLEDWYCLLRKAQGDLFPYNRDLRHMIDSHTFLYDSLFCEWAYIINLDREVLETYRGFNEDPRAPGRYARYGRLTSNQGYAGVALIDELPLTAIRPDSIDALVVRMDWKGRELEA